MNQKNRQRWQQIRQQGRKRFIYRRGVLTWGLTTGILVTIFNDVINSSHTHRTFVRLLGNSVFGILVFMMAGYMWGLIMWNLMERRYK